MSNTLTHEIRLNNLVHESIVDGFGLRFVVFTQGCKLRCYMCHNPETQDLNGGMYYNIYEIRKSWKKNPLLHGITISGGEPFLQPESVYNLIELALEDKLNVIVYSGYTYEALKARKCKYTDLILEKSDYLIDGPFIYQLKNLNLLWRGSSNQRIVDLKETHRLNRVVMYQE